MELCDVGPTCCCRLKNLVDAHQVGTVLAFITPEAAEAAMSVTNISVVDVPVLIKVDTVSVLSPVHPVRQHAHHHQITRFVEANAVIYAQTLATLNLSNNITQFCFWKCNLQHNCSWSLVYQATTVECGFIQHVVAPTYLHP